MTTSTPKSNLSESVSHKAVTPLITASEFSDSSFPNANPLDAKSFDVISFINQLFPNEQSLSTADSILYKFKKKIQFFDEQIEKHLLQQTNKGKSNAQELENVTKAMQALCLNVVSIKEKSKTAEDVVQNMTREIKSLDLAKKNIIATITLLRRLSMFNTAIKQLKSHANQREYKQVALLFKVLSQLETHFKSFRNIPKVVELLNQLHLIQSDLRKQILELFDASFTTNAMLQSTVEPQQLCEACLVLENVDIAAKRQLQDWYISLALREYRTIFNSKEELASLIHVHRRFSWLKRFLKMYDEEQKRVFPSDWNMDYLLCLKFGEETKAGLLEVALNVKDAKLLLRTLRSCIEFEAAVVSRFSDISPEFSVISSAFENQMSVYMEAEDKNLNDLFSKLKLAPLKSDEGNQSVLSSSTELFIAYKDLVTQFSKLGKGKLILDLCELIAKYLGKYAEFLDEQVRGERKGMTTLDWKNACLILNTCHYCLNITQQLQDKFLDMVTSSYKSKITLEPQVDLFKSASMQTIKFLVKSFECSLDSVWIAILKVSWATLPSAGDQSSYVSQFNKTVAEIVPILAESINETSLFKSFCDKFAEAIPAHIYQCILKAKPIGEAGAEQLLLDIHAIKQTCSNVPSMASYDAQPSSIFTKVLNKGFLKLETLLKVLLSPASPPEAFVHCFLNVYPTEEIKKQQFQLILELKGLKKTEISPILGIFITQSAERKIPTSPTTSEDLGASQMKRIFSFSPVK